MDSTTHCPPSSIAHRPRPQRSGVRNGLTATLLAILVFACTLPVELYARQDVDGFFELGLVDWTEVLPGLLELLRRFIMHGIC